MKEEQVDLGCRVLRGLWGSWLWNPEEHLPGIAHWVFGFWNSVSRVCVWGGLGGVLRRGALQEFSISYGLWACLTEGGVGTWSIVEAAAQLTV